METLRGPVETLNIRHRSQYQTVRRSVQVKCWAKGLLDLWNFMETVKAIIKDGDAPEVVVTGSFVSDEVLLAYSHRHWPHSIAGEDVCAW